MFLKNLRRGCPKLTCDQWVIWIDQAVVTFDRYEIGFVGPPLPLSARHLVLGLGLTSAERPIWPEEKIFKTFFVKIAKP